MRHRFLFLSLCLLLASLSQTQAGPSDEDELDAFSDNVTLILIVDHSVLIKKNDEEFAYVLRKGDRQFDYKLITINKDNAEFSNAIETIQLKLSDTFLKSIHPEIPDYLQKRIDYYTEQLKQDPDNKKAILNFCQILWEFRPDEVYSILENYLDQYPDDYSAQVLQSICMLKLTLYPQAVDYLKSCIEKSSDPFDSYNLGIHYYNLACSFALLHKKKEAILNLQKSIDLATFKQSMVANDPDFNSIKDSPEFDNIIKQLEK